MAPYSQQQDKNDIRIYDRSDKEVIGLKIEYKPCYFAPQILIRTRWVLSWIFYQINPSPITIWEPIKWLSEPFLLIIKLQYLINVMIKSECRYKVGFETCRAEGQHLGLRFSCLPICLKNDQSGAAGQSNTKYNKRNLDSRL